MSTYNTETRCLHVSRFRGVALKTLRDVSRAFLDEGAWETGEVILGGRQFPVRVRSGRDETSSYLFFYKLLAWLGLSGLISKNRTYPLAFRPLELVPCAEFDQFFDFWTSADYDPDRVVAARAGMVGPTGT